MQSQLPELLQLISAAYPNSQPYVDKILAQGINADRRVIDDSKVSDHHAIIITKRYWPIRLDQVY